MTNMCSYILSCLLTAHHNEKCVQGGKRTTFRSIFGLWKITLSLFTTRKISWDFMAPAPNQFRLWKPKSTPRYKVGLTLLIPITTKSLFGRYKMGPKSPCEKKILTQWADKSKRDDNSTMTWFLLTSSDSCLLWFVKNIGCPTKFLTVLIFTKKAESLIIYFFIGMVTASAALDLSKLKSVWTTFSIWTKIHTFANSSLGGAIFHSRALITQHDGKKSSNDKWDVDEPSKV